MDLTRVHDVIAAALKRELGGIELADDLDLVESGIIDSLALTTIVAALEQAYPGLRIPDSDATVRPWPRSIASRRTWPGAGRRGGLSSDHAPHRRERATPWRSGDVGSTRRAPRSGALPAMSAIGMAHRGRAPRFRRLLCKRLARDDSDGVRATPILSSRSAARDL